MILLALRQGIQVTFFGNAAYVLARLGMPAVKQAIVETRLFLGYLTAAFLPNIYMLSFIKTHLAFQFHFFNSVFSSLSQVSEICSALNPQFGCFSTRRQNSELKSEQNWHFIKKQQIVSQNCDRSGGSTEFKHMIHTGACQATVTILLVWIGWLPATRAVRVPRVAVLWRHSSGASTRPTLRYFYFFL